MRVGILSESPADEAALEVLVEAVVARPIQRVGNLRLSGRGYRPIVSSVKQVIRYYTFAERVDALVVVLDSDDTVPHGSALDAVESKPSRQCRLCRLHGDLEAERSRLESPVRLCLGVAMPAIEAWYLCGEDAHVTEAAWVAGYAPPARRPFDRNGLKRRVYGTERPGIGLATDVAVRHARRLALDLTALETCFPSGFGTLARALRDVQSA